MSLYNGLTKTHHTTCHRCGAQSLLFQGELPTVQSYLRAHGWRPERVIVTPPATRLASGEVYQRGSHNETHWYCPACEQSRPSLKRNQKETP